MRRRASFIAAIATMCVTVAQPVAAQSLRGVVRDSASGQPIGGAVVMLLDSAGARVARNISDERGQYRVGRASAARSARIVRIGFQPRELRLPPSDQTAFDIGMLPVSTMLMAVRVEERSNCPRHPDDAATFGLWEQARAGLLATIVAEEANPADMARLMFERRFDGNSDRITRFAVDVRSSDRLSKPFRAASSAGDFVNSGFASDSSGVQLLFGPDAEILLDPAFAAAYCFRQAPKTRARPNQIGLAFAPARNQDGRVDIDGTLWIDTSARALSDIEFRYLGLPSYTAQFSPGGSISFRRMANGIVLMDQWKLRGIVANSARVDTAKVRVFSRGLSAIEFGGELARATWSGGRTWRASLGTLRVHAERDGRPAPGVVVALRDTKYSGLADANGDIEIGDLAPGPYWLQVADPRLSDLGFNIPTPVTFAAVRDSTFRTTLKVPTAEEWVIGNCLALHQWKSGSSDLLVGRVITPDGQPVNDAGVTYEVRVGVATWKSLGDNFTTGSDGIFQSCNPALARGSPVRIIVRRDGAPDFTVTARLETRLTVVPVRVPAIVP